MRAHVVCTRAVCFRVGCTLVESSLWLPCETRAGAVKGTHSVNRQLALVLRPCPVRPQWMWWDEFSGTTCSGAAGVSDTPCAFFHPTNFGSRTTSFPQVVDVENAQPVHANNCLVCLIELARIVVWHGEDCEQASAAGRGNFRGDPCDLNGYRTMSEGRRRMVMSS